MNDIAVVGMSCRLPGGVNSPDELWQRILGKHVAAGEIPSKRWEPWSRRDARNSKVLDDAPKCGYFLDNLEDFDPVFFGISPKEAEQMDPQQRITLEVAWQALEEAGISPQRLSGSDTGVFIGVNSDDYSRLLLEDLPRLEPWMGIGTAYCGVPNRVSYQLNLMGPSLAVDAACASSLVAIHLGRQAILQGECTVAIVGGVNALCSPGMSIVLDRAGATSKEGICQSFDDVVHGYGRGEGAAIVILKSMDEAIKDGDNIRAIIKGSAVAQDGRTNGIMAPNAHAQELVARKALQTAGLDPKSISYVEAHATSTPLGDKTEIAAISRVYGDVEKAGNRCYIGSVKPNVGHLEAGAGVVGFIKSVMSVCTGILPPQANLENLNSNIDWENAGIDVVQNTIEWPQSDKPRRAGVCSYGYGGTVSHMIIEQYTSSKAGREPRDGPQVLLLSAPSGKRVSAEAKKLSSWMNNAGKKHALACIATTLATRRAHHNHRAALVVDDHNDATEILKSLSEGLSTEWAFQNQVPTNGSNENVTFIFSGHGSQWTDMGKDLLHEKVFHDTIASLEPIVEVEMGFSALESFRTGDFETTDKVQVLTYLLQVGLVAVLGSKGLHANAVIGHSVGEIAAAVCAGCLTPSEGILIVTKRAKLYREIMGAGAMAVVFKPFDEMKKTLGSRNDVVAAIDSSPSSCVLSGDKQAIEVICKSLLDQGVKTLRVKTDIAFHHPSLMSQIEPLSRALDGLLAPRPPKIKIYSTSQDEPHSLHPHDIDYWCKNMVQPVKLTSAVSSAATDGLRVFLEVSAHPIVSHSVQETLIDLSVKDFDVYHTMSRRQPPEKTILSSLGQLHCRGCNIDWNKSLAQPWTSEVPLTGWSHQKIWRNIETGPLGTGMTHDIEQHVLLGSRVAVAGEDVATYATTIDEDSNPFPGQHPVQGSEIIPAAVLINTFLLGTGSQELSNFHLRVPITTNKRREIQFVVKAGHAKLCSRLDRNDKENSPNSSSWQTHTTSCWSTAAPFQINTPHKIDIISKKASINARLADNFSVDYLSRVGVPRMGFPWTILEHYGNQHEMIALVDVAPDFDSSASLPWDPRSWAPILDSATSVASTLFFNDPRLRMPSFVNKISVLCDQPPPKLCYLFITAVSDQIPKAHISICDEAGTILLHIDTMEFSEIEGGRLSDGGVESLVHQIAWPPAFYAETALPINHLVLISRDSDLARRYSESLPQDLHKITVVNSVGELCHQQLSLDGETTIAYLPLPDVPLDSAALAAYDHVQDMLDVTKFLMNSNLSIKVFVLTHGVLSGHSAGLAQSTLHGLSRIIASEHPSIWGALIDLEVPKIPLEVMKYVQQEEVIRISDGIPRIARLRPLQQHQLLPLSRIPQLSSPEGSYLISGGLGALGLETAKFLVEQGSRRLILVSRRTLPPRRTWHTAIAESSPVAPVLERIQGLEAYGATIKILQFDLGSDSTAQQLSKAIDTLDLPPISGVIHAAGVIEDELVLSTTAEGLRRVLAPKVSGAILLHQLFPPKSLDFMILFSSCGQLFGFPGQASYASGNAFLDALATHRRNEGDNTVSLLWSSWRGLGMSISTAFIDAELANKGITDITRGEAFQALLQVLKFDVSQAAVLRALSIHDNEPLPSQILADIIKRKRLTSSPSENSSSSTSPATPVPLSMEERRAYLEQGIRDSVSNVLHLPGAEDVDPKAVMSDLGLDSVLTVSLRGVLQKTFGVSVPATLTWTCPTVSDLVDWFEDKI
ncbi:polyketide synthase [Penicillium tannophilum]|nr:polyketide synthase [Penicillium tannophilum]